jgi:multiple sugar transport system substrate-binding protein
MAETTLRGITWDHDRGLRPLVATADVYRERFPGVRVEWQGRTLQAFADQDVAALAEKFDLIVLDHPSIGYAVERRCLARLDDRPDRVDPSFIDDQRRNSVGRSFESYVWENALWALPIDAAAQVASHRPDLLDRLDAGVPETWDEVLGLGRAARAVDAYVAMPSIPVDAVCAYFAKATADGADPFTGNRDARAEALEVLRELISIAHPASTTWNPPRMYERMASADDVVYCPLAFGYSNYARPGYRPRLVEFTPPPAGRTGARVGTLGGAGIAVSASSPNTDEAIHYATFVASKEVQQREYVGAEGQPAHRAAWFDDDANAISNGYFRATLPGVDGAYLRPRHAGFLEFQDSAGALAHAFLRDGGGAVDVIDRLDAIDAETRYRRSGRAGT